jgi:phosphoribosylamine--glycine ligase
MVTGLVCAPGNAGIAKIARCVDVPPTDLEGLVRLAHDNAVDLTIVGPELPLTMGIVDVFNEEGLTIFGPTKEAARLEGSKAFAKDLMGRHGIPTADYRVFDVRDEAATYITAQGAPIVVKADGLAAGKGVFVAQTVEDALAALDITMVEKVFGDSGRRVVIEEYLSGEEASFIAFSDGTRVLPLASSQDHKPVFDGDQGPNTGGMGAYSPAPVVTETLHNRIMEEIMLPTVRAMAEEGSPYRGILYAGLSIQGNVPKVLEFNCRFGDPETQPIVMRMHGDVIPVIERSITGALSGAELSWDTRYAVCVVMASGGYPGSYEKGHIISGLDVVDHMEDVHIFHAGTASKDGQILTAGGRVLGVTGLGGGIREAMETTYRAVSLVRWEGVHWRTDIGKKALDRLEDRHHG